MIAELFSLPLLDGYIAAARDCPSRFMSGRPMDEIQAGLVVLRPNRTLHASLLKSIKMFSVDKSAQGMFTTYFKGRVKFLSNKVNYIPSSKCVALSNFTDGVVRWSHKDIEKVASHMNLPQNVATAFATILE